jgi:hypothetical protein
VTRKELLKLGSSGPINELILHYDILWPHYRGLDSHAADPVMSRLGQVETVAFFTLKTTLERLSAQLAGRIATGPKVSQRLRWLQELYQDEGFIVDWYERWFRFVQHFRAGTTVHYIVDADRGYELTKVT